MQITTIGIDLAKNLFQVHGANERGKTVLRKQLRREQVMTFFANLPSCLIGMEACGSAHHWARKLQGLGHTVRLMAPQFVKPYVKSNKNDAADAQAICEAVTRPTMRFVPIKNVEQQTVLSLHRARQSFIKARTAQANQIRGLLGEFGLVVPQGIPSQHRWIGLRRIEAVRGRVHTLATRDCEDYRASKRVLRSRDAVMVFLDSCETERVVATQSRARGAYIDTVVSIWRWGFDAYFTTPILKTYMPFRSLTKRH